MEGCGIFVRVIGISLLLAIRNVLKKNLLLRRIIYQFQRW
jgi:hypothetical protein